jgi:hypothetical protein
MRARKRYLGQMDSTLREWSLQIADLEWKGLSGEPEQRARVAGRVVALRQQRDAYEAGMSEIRDTNAGMFREGRSRAERLAAEFRRIYIQSASRFAG